LKVKVHHAKNEITTVETGRLRLVFEDGRLIAVDTDKRTFYDISLIEIGGD